MAEDIYKNYTSIAVLDDKSFESFTSWSSLYFRKVIKPLIPVNKDIAILEIGCGYGRYLKAFHENGYRNTCGVDISEEQINYGKEHLKLENIFRSDALQFIEASDKTFDVILAIDVFEHLELEYAVLLTKKIYEKLNPGGLVILQTPNGINLKKILEKLIYILMI